MMEFKCNNVTITLKDSKVIVNNLNFILNKGDKLALIGEEGNGKSTLLKYFVDPKLIDNYCYYKGNVEYKGNIGYLRQTLNEYSEYDIFTFLAMNKDDEIDYEIYNKEYIIKKLFNEFNLDKNILENNKQIKYLSGGERVKLQLIKLQLNDCSVLLLDEPSNDLDLNTLEFLENYLISIDTPLIFVSHDEHLLKKVSNRILHFDQIKDNGKITTTLMNVGYNEYIINRKTKIEKQNNKVYLEEKEIKRKKEILSKIKQKVESDMAKAVRDPSWGRLLVKKMRNIKAQERRVGSKEDNKLNYLVDKEEINASFSSSLKKVPNKKVIVNLKDYNLKINNKLLVRDINLVVTGNEHICIIGDNGSGKTTLLKAIKDNINESELIKVGYFPQNYEELLDMEMKVVEYLQKNLSSDNETKCKIMTYLSAFNFMEYELDLKIKDLSIGEQGKVLLIKLIIEECNVLLLDEPTRNMSTLSLPTILNILSEFKGCIISISHDRNYINKVCDKVYKIEDKKLVLVNE